VTAEPFPTPFYLFTGHVRADWIDGNGHMNLAFYVVLFDQAIDLLFDAVGFGAEYRAAAGCGPFAVETHTQYEQELLEGQRVGVTSRVMDVDSKRLHIAHEMFRDSGLRAATQELMFLHVDLTMRRVVPFPAALRARLERAADAHAALGRPDWIGRSIRMPPRTD
jgi:acyl-CoA thioester hydrolase